MALLPYEVVQIDQTRWGTLESIESYLLVDGQKQGITAVDPLIDYRVLNPQDAYYPDST